MLGWGHNYRVHSDRLGRRVQILSQHISLKKGHVSSFNLSIFLRQYLAQLFLIGKWTINAIDILIALILRLLY